MYPFQRDALFFPLFPNPESVLKSASEEDLMAPCGLIFSSAPPSSPKGSILKLSKRTNEALDLAKGTLKLSPDQSFSSEQTQKWQKLFLQEHAPVQQSSPAHFLEHHHRKQIQQRPVRSFYLSLANKELFSMCHDKTSFRSNQLHINRPHRTNNPPSCSPHLTHSCHPIFKGFPSATSLFILPPFLAKAAVGRAQSRRDLKPDLKTQTAPLCKLIASNSLVLTLHKDFFFHYLFPFSVCSQVSPFQPFSSIP